VINYRNKSQYFIGLCLNLRFYRASPLSRDG
jgi:hypothetical protein